MVGIQAIKKEDNRVIFTIKTWNRVFNVELKERYLIYSINRWDYCLNEIEHYFFKNAPKGSFLGSGEKYNNLPKGYGHYHKFSDICIWDLKKIFSNVNFIENNDLEKQVITEYNKKYITEFGIHRNKL